MSTSNAAATADYLKAWQKLDMDGAFRDIHPHVTYTGALQSLEGKDAIRAFFESFAKMVEKVVVRAHAVEGDHAFVGFDFHCPAPSGDRQRGGDADLRRRPNHGHRTLLRPASLLAQRIEAPAERDLVAAVGFRLGERLGQGGRSEGSAD